MEWYKVVGANGTDELTKLVTESIKNGWKVSGGVCIVWESVKHIDGAYYEVHAYQSMVKDNMVPQN